MFIPLTRTFSHIITYTLAPLCHWLETKVKHRIKEYICFIAIASKYASTF